MKLLLVDNIHIFKTSDGQYYTPSIYDYKFFQRYLSVFSSVRIVAKTKYVEKLDTSKLIKVDFDNIEVFELPWYQGSRELIAKILNVSRVARKCGEKCDRVIFRVAQIESFLVYLFSSVKLKPFALEVVNDPSSFSDVNFLFRFLSVSLLKVMCKKANGVSYVTEKILQTKYPCRVMLGRGSGKSFMTNYSSIDLEDKYIMAPKKYGFMKSVNLVHVANVIDGEAKGHRTVIEVVKRLNDEGLDVEVSFIGDGPGVDIFKNLTSLYRIDGKVHFIGRLSNKEEYMQKLRQLDLFIFPSHYEGLPRVVIEAMACGLPCLASPVGGMEELLPNEYLVAHNDIEKYIELIQRFSNNSDELNQMSESNIKTVRKYSYSNLSKKRANFYRALANC